MSTNEKQENGISNGVKKNNQQSIIDDSSEKTLMQIDCLLPMLNDINNKLNTIANKKERTKEIINIAKETYKNEKIKNNKFYIILAVVVSFFLGWVLFDIHLYCHNKSEQVKIINTKLNENVLTESQIKEITERLEECNSKIKELESLVNQINNSTNKTEETNKNQG